MLQIDLENLISQINARRNKVRYSFQELGLLLTEKLNDPKSKALYMKLAKNEEQELLMRAYSYTVNTLTGGENKGRFFMWKLSQLKHASIEPLNILIRIKKDETDTSTVFIKIGTIDVKIRSEYPFACAGVQLLRDKYGEIIDLDGELLEGSQINNDKVIKITSSLFFRLKNSLISFFKELDKTYPISFNSHVRVKEQDASVILTGEDKKVHLTGIMSVSPPRFIETPKKYSSQYRKPL